MKPIKRINCHKCRYYYITWDNKHPHGCRAMGFRSKQFPSTVVYNNSGVPCRYFEPKQKRTSGGTMEKKGSGKRYA